MAYSATTGTAGVNFVYTATVTNYAADSPSVPVSTKFYDTATGFGYWKDANGNIAELHRPAGNAAVLNAVQTFSAQQTFAEKIAIAINRALQWGVGAEIAAIIHDNINMVFRNGIGRTLFYNLSSGSPSFRFHVGSDTRAAVSIYPDGRIRFSNQVVALANDISADAWLHLMPSSTAAATAFLPNGVAPTANPVAGVFMFCENGQLKVKNPAGVITNVGSAASDITLSAQFTAADNTLLSAYTPDTGTFTAIITGTLAITGNALRFTQGGAAAHAYIRLTAANSRTVAQIKSLTAGFSVIIDKRRQDAGASGTPSMVRFQVNRLNATEIVVYITEFNAGTQTVLYNSGALAMGLVPFSLTCTVSGTSATIQVNADTPTVRTVSLTLAGNDLLYSDGSDIDSMLHENL